MAETSIAVDEKNSLPVEDPPLESTPEVTIDRPDGPPSKILHPLSGVLYSLFAAFLFTSSIFITKQLHVELLNALIPRYLFQSVLSIIYMKCIKNYSLYGEAKEGEKLMLFLNVFFTSTGFVAFFVAYRYLPLPDLTTVRYTQVIWTAILIAILYREKPSIATIVAVILTAVGVVFVAQPHFLFLKVVTDYSQHRLLGLFIALYSSVAMTIMVITNKHLLSKYRTKQSLIMLQFTVVTLAMTMVHLVYQYIYVNDPNHTLKKDFLNWRYLGAATVCLFQIIASVAIQKSVKREHPSIFTILQSSEILFAILLQNIFSSVKSNPLSLFGSILVLTSIGIISGYKLITERKARAPNTSSK